MGVMRIGARWRALAIAATTIGIVVSSAGADKPAADTGDWRATGVAFEMARALPAADRLAELERLDADLAGRMKRMEEGDRAAARFLSAAILHERGNDAAAVEGFRTAAKGLEKTPFADDAAFAAIQALEAQGKDEEAAIEWKKWEERYATSPLVGEARLAQCWNHLRAGKSPEARRALTALVAAQPWMSRDARVGLAQATLCYQEKKPAEALAALGTKTSGAPATYLRGLCFLAQGSTLKAAALFQEVVERYPDSSLRDPALFAKANTFLGARDYRSAAEEFRKVAGQVKDPGIQAESELRSAGALFLADSLDQALASLRDIAERRHGADVAARAQFLIGEILVKEKKPAEAIPEFNRVLTEYFQHSVAASAQYRVARCLDADGRHADATSAYQTVVSGYPLEPEAPAAAYLAGVGLLDQHRPLVAAPYFQLVLDRYAAHGDSAGMVVFASPEHQELVEAALCLLEYSYHQAGDLGRLSGAPHLLLSRMPPSRSPWRAYALLIDADASAAMARHAEAQSQLERLTREFPDHPVGASANKLLAWTYAQQGRDSLAIATEERMLARYAASGNTDVLASSFLDIAHSRFNQKRYAEAAAAYEDFLRRFPGHRERPVALYQAGLCYLRLDRGGDAVDRWESIVRENADAPIAERAWARAGDLYFQAERFEDARRAYQGLLAHFAQSSAASLASLRLAQCDYNAGRDAAALEGFSQTAQRYPGTPAAREAGRGTELALYRLGQRPDGAQVLAKLVEQYPTSSFAADAQFQIAWHAYQAKRYAEAAEGFRRVVSQFPGYSAADRAHFLMADAHAQAGEGERAANDYEQFLSFFAESELRPTVQFRLGLLRFENKDYLRAAMLFTRVLDDSVAADVSAAARYNLALCDRLLGRPDEALAELERYRAEHPSDERTASVALQIGDLKETAGDRQAALAEFERGLASHPAPRVATELGFRAGRCREQMGDVDAALKAYQSATASAERDDPFRLSAVARCAALYEAKRDYARALTAYRDIARNAKDPELVAAATERVSQLEGSTRAR